MTTPLFDRIAIIGIGLIGSSISHATRRKGLAKEIVGSARTKETLNTALRLGLVDKGYDMAFFEANGEPTEYTKNCIEFCNNFEVERQRTVSFVQILKDLDLFETKEATFTPANPDGTQGEVQKIAEYFGVSEEKLNALPADKFVELRDNGALGQIYAHMHSLVGWDRMIALALTKAAAQQPVAANA